MYKIFSANLVVLLLLTACSSTPERTANVTSMDQLLMNMSEQDGRACIRIAEIQGYAQLDDQLLSVDALGKRHYLLTTVRRCNSLGWSHQLVFDGNFAQVCGRSTDAVVTRDESCTVKSIYQFVSKEDALATFEMAKARREVQAQFPAPPEK